MSLRSTIAALSLAFLTSILGCSDAGRSGNAEDERRAGEGRTASTEPVRAERNASDEDRVRQKAATTKVATHETGPAAHADADMRRMAKEDEAKDKYSKTPAASSVVAGGTGVDQRKEQLIWPTKTYYDEYTSAKSFVNMGAADAGMDGRGLAAMRKLLDQVTKATNVAEQAGPMEKQSHLLKGFIADGRGLIKDVYRPMLEALDNDDAAEFNRLSNVVNARNLLQNATELGIKADEGGNEMRQLYDVVAKAKDAASQKKPISEMQRLLDSFVEKSKGK